MQEQVGLSCIEKGAEHSGDRVMFRKVLIANRGEIAVRIAQACQELGVRAVAVYSEVDREALHVARADEAYPIGPAPAAESYLRIPRLIELARRCGCWATRRRPSSWRGGRACRWCPATRARPRRRDGCWRERGR